MTQLQDGGAVNQFHIFLSLLLLGLTYPSVPTSLQGAFHCPHGSLQSSELPRSSLPVLLFALSLNGVLFQFMLHVSILFSHQTVSP